MAAFLHNKMSSMRRTIKPWIYYFLLLYQLKSLLIIPVYFYHFVLFFLELEFFFKEWKQFMHLNFQFKYCGEFWAIFFSCILVIHLTLPWFLYACYALHDIVACICAIVFNTSSLTCYYGFSLHFEVSRNL